MNMLDNAVKYEPEKEVSFFIKISWNLLMSIYREYYICTVQ